MLPWLQTRPRRALVYLSTSTQPCILPGLLNRVQASAGVNAGMSITSAGVAGNTV